MTSAATLEWQKLKNSKGYTRTTWVPFHENIDYIFNYIDIDCKRSVISWTYCGTEGYILHLVTSWNCGYTIFGSSIYFSIPTDVCM